MFYTVKCDAPSMLIGIFSFNIEFMQNLLYLKNVNIVKDHILYTI